MKRDVSRTKIYLDTFPFNHFDDKYFWTEGVLANNLENLNLLHSLMPLQIFLMLKIDMQNMPRPFKKMRELDMDKVIKDIAQKIA